jgi:hypothetical protein
MAIGWLANIAEAVSYFQTERLESAFWDALTHVSGGKDERVAALLQAYNRIRTAAGVSIPASPSAAELVELKLAQLEMAYYLAGHSEDEDKRLGLQAQNVVSAGYVQETYKLDRPGTLPPWILALLPSFTAARSIIAVDLRRDENLDVDGNTNIT